MAQLDQLINAMFQHNGEALVLEPDQKPSLLTGGQPRPIVKSALSAAHVSRLTSEIAPAEQRAAIAGGGTGSFTYEVGGKSVAVEIVAGARATIRPAAAAAPAQARQPAVPAPVEAAAAEPPAAVPVSSAPAEAPESSRVDPAMTRLSSGDLSMDGLLRQLVETGGSDLHLSSDSRPMLRVDGGMRGIDEIGDLPAERVEQLLLSITPERNKEEFRDTGDTDFAYEIEGLCRFRSNLFKDRKGPGGVFRIIPSEILTAEQLGLSEAVKNLCSLTKGLVLVTGPTGSGKSTTLCGMVDLINRERNDHIITIEDPIEFVHPNKNCLVNQREVHLHTGSFKKALRAALREDPDIVLVGELRDLETVAIAIETAETGHLVCGTLHTISAVSTVYRIIDQFPADQQEQIRIMLSESIRGVIAQVLCKKIGGGRVAAQEVLIVNAAISNLIREGKTFQIPSIMQTARRQGNVLLNDALLGLVKDGKVEPKEAYLKAIDKKSLLSAFQKANIKTDFLSSDEPKKKALVPA
jgi:twitching motility protein PilT